MEAVFPPLFDARLLVDDFDELEDGQLLGFVRMGSREAYAVLFSRYRVAGFRFARYLSNSVEAKDIVSETFAQILHQLREGRGPDASFRSYLFTCIRREAGRRAKLVRRVSPTDDVVMMDRSVSMFDGGVDGFERDIVRAAFESLPERWQNVLWRMEVDGLKPHEIAPALSMTPNGVSALAWRAREGLRRAYLHQHLASLPEDQPDSACDETRRRLAAFVRGTATTRDWSLVDSHLESCAACAAVHLELEGVNAHLGAVATAIAVAFAAPASGVLGGLVAKTAVLAKSMAATVGSTAAVVATTVTVAQIPAIPPAAATSVHARPHPSIQLETDRTQGPAADHGTAPRADAERPSRESQSTGRAPATPTSTSGPVSAQIDDRGIQTSAGEVSASIDRSGLSGSWGEVNASIDQGGVKASVGEIEVTVPANKSAKSVTNEPAKETRASKPAARSEKPTDTASDAVEKE